MSTNNLTSTLLKYNNKDMGTWLKKSVKSGKNFYSIVVKTDDENLNVSFILAPKFVYRDEKMNLETGSLGNQNIYIINEWDYTVSVYDKTKKEATEKKVSGTKLIEIIKKNIREVNIVLTDSKSNTTSTPQLDI